MAHPIFRKFKAKAVNCFILGLDSSIWVLPVERVTIPFQWMNLKAHKKGKIVLFIEQNLGRATKKQ